MPGIKRNGRTYAGTPTRVDTAKSYTTFTSKDVANPDSWEDVELLASKEEQQSLFSKISTMFKNIRYLYKVLGTADIFNIADGTVTGALNKVNENLSQMSGEHTYKVSIAINTNVETTNMTPFSYKGVSNALAEGIEILGVFVRTPSSGDWLFSTSTNNTTGRITLYANGNAVIICDVIYRKTNN